jgi:hypothetical protein
MKRKYQPEYQRLFWVIYSRPTDYPDSAFVMREHYIDKDGTHPTAKVWTAESIEELREHLPLGAIAFARVANDEAQIIEWWADAKSTVK